MFFHMLNFILCENKPNNQDQFILFVLLESKKVVFCVFKLIQYAVHTVTMTVPLMCGQTIINL